MMRLVVGEFTGEQTITTETWKNRNEGESIKLIEKLLRRFASDIVLRTFYLRNIE